MPGVTFAQGATQPPEACERLASLSLPNTTITLAQVVNAGRVRRARQRAARRRRLVRAGRDDRSGSGSAWASDGQHRGSGPWLQRRSRHSAVQCAARVLPRDGNARAVALLRHPHGDVDADRRVERQLPRHEPQRSGRRDQLQRDGRRRDRRLRCRRAPTQGIRVATPRGCGIPRS